MKRLAPFVAVVILLAAGCVSSQQLLLPGSGATSQHLYVPNLASVTVYALPIQGTSTPIVVLSGFAAAVEVAFDSLGHAFVLEVGTTPAKVFQFSLPLTASSTPTATVNLPTGTNGRFESIDASNNLWVSDIGNGGKVYEFVGPFSGTTTPSPTITLSNSLNGPEGLAFDSFGNLYVGNQGSTTIEVFNAPLTNGEAASKTLNGANSPRGIAFDSAGNLYATNSPGSIARYSGPPPFTNGATPAIVDPNSNTGIGCGNGATLDSVGNLYVSDCAVANRHLAEFANATATFSSSSTPSVTLAGRAEAITVGP